MSTEARLKRLGLSHLANDPVALHKALLAQQQEADAKYPPSAAELKHRNLPPPVMPPQETPLANQPKSNVVSLGIPADVKNPQAYLILMQLRKNRGKPIRYRQLKPTSLELDRQTIQNGNSSSLPPKKPSR